MGACSSARDADFERELLDRALDDMLFSKGSYAAYDIPRIAGSRRTVSVLAAGSLFTEHIKKDLCAIYGRGSDVAAAADKVMDEERKKRLGFRAMCELRNHTLHRGLPFGIGFNRATDESGGERKLRNSVKPNLSLKALRDDPRFDWSVLKELGAQAKDGRFVCSSRSCVTTWKGSAVSCLDCVRRWLRT